MEESISGICSVREGTKTIIASAFEGCASLTKINIPDSVTKIGAGALNVCLELTSVTFENTEGWKVNGEEVDVTDPEQNALLLNSRYDNVPLERN